MRYCTLIILFAFGWRCVVCFWPPAFKVDLNDGKEFVIASDDSEYDEEKENEMIQAEDLVEFESLAEDEEKYKPLHSHVENYNKAAARTATEFSDYLFQNSLEPSLEDIHNLVEEAKPYVAGFKHELDEYDFDDLEERIYKAVRKKRDVLEHSTKSNAETLTSGDTEEPIWKSTSSLNRRRMEAGTEKEIESSEKDNKTTTERNEEIKDEEDYDYHKFKAEYYEELEYGSKDNRTFNYTDNGEPEETVEDAIKKVVDFKMPKNCTKEELTEFGAKAFECLAYDYKNAKSERNVKQILSRTWIVMRVWICIYLFVAVPCWCQKGWCCCCFTCAFCKPRDTIFRAKTYYAENPPGVLMEHDKSLGKEPQVTEFEPTLFELEAYEKFESAIRNL